MSKRLNIRAALETLSRPCTNEEVLHEVARQHNTRFNEMEQLQKDVDTALEQGLFFGFVGHSDGVYTLTQPANEGKGRPAGHFVDHGNKLKETNDLKPEVSEDSILSSSDIEK